MVASNNEYKIAFRLYQESDADEMAILLSDVFPKHDPPAVAVGLTQPEFETFVRLFCARATEQRLTVVAHCTDNDEICGVLLTEDFASGLPDGIDDLSDNFNPIFDILGQLGDEYRGSQVIEPGNSIHLFLLGVSQRFSGKGVAQRLVPECLANGIERGYRMAVTEATNPTSQHIFRKHGFVDRVHRSYKTHEHDGRKPFASIADCGGPILMDKQLIDGEDD